ncbi:glutamate-1-semialdehyde 2,1-aminomutase [Alphaproteobacteria bacterium]|nr:glutamate-1-semialdehyde 2,1-aminomutase [Alphaproteobacteria bacterium]
MDYQARLQKVIPGGAHTYSRGRDQFPRNAPQILARGLGSRVWDPEGNEYLDYGMALRAVTLGYSNHRVNQAAIRQIENGNNLTRASLIELEAAELISQTIPGAEMVKFAKNGSNATTAAAKIARAYTNKRFICVPRQHPFFSFDDWFIGTTPIQRGIPQEHTSSTLVFDYNDIQSLRSLFDAYPGQIAAVMLEPATTVTPCIDECSELTANSDCVACPHKEKNFLHQVQAICRKEGALFILDEMITGFRWALEGAASYFGVQPDLMTFGKGMANGFSVAAVTGRREVMGVGAIDKSGAERVFLLSSTHGGEMSGLGAFIETVKIYQEEDVCRKLWNFGAQLKKQMNELAVELGIQDFFEIAGPAISLNYITRDPHGVGSLEYRTLFSQEMIRNGVLMPWIAQSWAHKAGELDQTLSAARSALEVYGRAIEEGLGNYLDGPSIKPVFRKFN